MNICAEKGFQELLDHDRKFYGDLEKSEALSRTDLEGIISIAETNLLQNFNHQNKPNNRAVKEFQLVLDHDRTFDRDLIIPPATWREFGRVTNSAHVNMYKNAAHACDPASPDFERLQFIKPFVHRWEVEVHGESVHMGG